MEDKPNETVRSDDAPKGETAPAPDTAPAQTEQPSIPSAASVPAAPDAGASGNAASGGTSGLAVAGLVLGILAILGAFIPLLNILTFPFAILGLILAIIGLLGINKGKHTGKGVAIAGIVLGAVALVVTVGMYGCAGAIASNGGSASSSSPESSQAASENAASPSSGGVDSAAAETQDASYVGTWNVVGYKDADNEISQAQLEAAGGDYFLNVYEDGTSVLQLSDNKIRSRWDEDASDQLIFTYGDAQATMLIEGESAEFTLVTTHGDAYTLSLEKSSTVKEIAGVPAEGLAGLLSAEETDAQDENLLENDTDAESAASQEETPTAEPSASAGEVSPDVKEALDSYEAFVDEYVAFMQEYSQSSDTASMMADYADFMQRYADFAQKIEAMDSSSMSSADYAYYIEVTSRCSQKLLAAM